ncbi:unnamed protein product [Sordaria macrospora k-hell]|uniref:WGS project CABT00000000 data, contig 2.4 n=2 Tax=Sordaria macrospora TaxID=5147 RepID=F7VR05_SORMK|nr:uncharacterized protein SMAC_01501 [Sordaria macrospora k-hell]CCC07938.1 unnamed protein product [Sordaria macrospora k-hell]
MFPFPAAAFTPQSQKGSSMSVKGYAQAQSAQQTHQPQTLKQQQQEAEQETKFLTLLSLLEKALRHTHYAVCGRAALYIWGYRQNPPENVSIVCPDGNEEIILLWAKTQGWTVVVSGVRGCSFEVTLPGKPGKDGKIREVTVKTAQRMGLTLGHDDLVKEGGIMPMAVKGTWAEAEKKVLKTTAAVVTLPALLGMLIEGFITEVNPRHHHHHQQHHHQSEPKAEPKSEAAARDSSQKRVEEAAKIILWVLSRLAERGERLSQDQVPETFLTPFLAGWPEAHALLEELGVSTFDSHFDYHQDQDQADSQPKPEQKSESESRSRLTLDAGTLAALEGLPFVPPIPPRSPKRMTPLSQRAPERTTSAASAASVASSLSCTSENTIALIQNEIESWNYLSLEEAALATREYETASPPLAASRLSRLSSKVLTAETDSTAAETDLMTEMTESINAWTTAYSSSSLATYTSTVPVVPALSTAGSSCSSKKSKSGSQLSSSSVTSGSQSGRSTAKRVLPPWKSSWDERIVRKGEYPEWI